MENIQNYGLIWFLYLLLAAGFTLLSFYYSRRLTFWLRIPILALVAAMAFTPASTIPGDTAMSPAAIVMIFEIDQNGMAGFWRAGLGIIVAWLILTIVGFIGRWLTRRKLSIKDNSNQTERDQEA